LKKTNTFSISSNIKNGPKTVDEEGMRVRVGDVGDCILPVDTFQSILWFSLHSPIPIRIPIFV